MNMDGDLGRHLTVGEYIISNASIPDTDLFSHTRFGEHFVPHEWLAEVAYALAYRVSGFTGVVILAAQLLGITWLIIGMQTARKSNSIGWNFGLLLLGVAGSSMHWLTRPHLFTFLFLAILVAILENSRLTAKKIVLITVLMLLWVNSHGAFIAGFVYVGIKLFGEVLENSFRERKVSFQKLLILAITMLGLFLISLINPAGLHIYDTIFGFLSSRYLVMNTVEYLPPDLLDIHFFPFTIYILIVAFLGIRKWKSLHPGDVLQVLFWTATSFVSARNIPLAMIATIPILAGWSALQKPAEIADTVEVTEPDRRQTRGILLISGLMVVVMVAIVLLIPAAGKNYRFSESKFPVKAVSFLLEHPQKGNLFNQFEWGGYLLYSMWPQQKVFIDGQTDFYGEELTKEYSRLFNALNGYEEVIHKYDVSWMIVGINSPIAKILADEPDNWEVIYRDDVSIVLAARLPQ